MENVNVNVVLSNDELSKLINSLVRTIEWMNDAEELKELDETIINKKKQEHKDLLRKLDAILFEQYQILKEARKNLKS